MNASTGGISPFGTPKRHSTSTVCTRRCSGNDGVGEAHYRFTASSGGGDEP
jgi:hypothetical protein